MKLALKILMMLGLTVAILVPLAMIRGTIAERSGYRQDAVRTIAASYGGRQTFAGPVLVVPYSEVVEDTVTDAAGTPRRTLRRRSGQWTFFPEALEVDGTLLPDTRRRGLHEVRVYRWQGRARARFDVRFPQDDPRAQRSIGQPWLSYGIADVRGLHASPVLRVDGRAQALLQGVGHADGPGLHARLPVPAADQRLRLATDLTLTLRGTERFAMLPLARSNTLRLRSTWPHPRFEGLSPQHELDASGFRAQWQLTSLASNAQRRYLQQPSLALADASSTGFAGTAPGEAPPLPEDSLGVSLIDPVNPYLQADRATKYGVLFVLLTFVGFFMFELLKRWRIHPIQYALVGLAIAIFFLLLLGLSEHFAFGWSYLAAAAACIGLIGFYLSAVLGGALRGVGFAAMLALLYAALYGLLLSEDNALVLGAGLLFVVLAAIMVATRRVDWYRVAANAPAAA